MSLLFVHEIGHYVTAKILKVEVDKIYIYPFGGLCKLNNKLNDSLLKEFIILIMGPLTQILFCYFIIKNDYFPNYNNAIIMYSNSLLFLNLLPIYPLDGGKLVNILFSLRYSFKKSLFYTFYFSYFVLLLLCVYFFTKDITINVVLILGLLAFKVLEEYRKRYFMVEKFLLERYLGAFHFHKVKEVSKIDDFMRNKRHIIYENGKYYSEKEALRKKFRKKSVKY